MYICREKLLHMIYMGQGLGWASPSPKLLSLVSAALYSKCVRHVRKIFFDLEMKDDGQFWTDFACFCSFGDINVASRCFWDVIHLLATPQAHQGRTNSIPCICGLFFLNFGFPWLGDTLGNTSWGFVCARNPWQMFWIVLHPGGGDTVSPLRLCLVSVWHWNSSSVFSEGNKLWFQVLSRN